MTIGEASRQYQIALEHERRGRAELAGVLSAEDELQRAAEDTDRARKHLRDLLRARKPADEGDGCDESERDRTRPETHAGNLGGVPGVLWPWDGR